ncbi:MAG: hypothetical protein U5N85_12715 [Arcicella sp.]|nr:hypothetical protein [Arcicella sp.]
MRLQILEKITAIRVTEQSLDGGYYPVSGSKLVNKVHNFDKKRGSEINSEPLLFCVNL